jgi:hypothetical protein
MASYMELPFQWLFFAPPPPVWQAPLLHIRTSVQQHYLVDLIGLINDFLFRFNPQMTKTR